ncbi:type VI secretion system lipoprotein TssJ [Candidatus Sororendozoicomonas aggregata]|uniref:type VI secretion system lipoprotein TssJ n=1 Tax=Candidatus Sororendozoicomonas aggregata TaxID=3073239 RepID=UPI002ED58812
MRSSCKPVALVAFVTFVLSGCASKLNPYYWFVDRETTLNLTLSAGKEINNSRSEVPSPLVVRLYELKSAELFQSADFLGIFLRDSKILQQSLVKKRRLPSIKPGGQFAKKYTLDKSTSYVALFGEFEDYNSAVPSVIYKVTKGDDNNLKVLINDDSLRMVSDNKSS